MDFLEHQLDCFFQERKKNKLKRVYGQMEDKTHSALLLLEFDDYYKVPEHLKEKIIEESQKDPENPV